MTIDEGYIETIRLALDVHRPCRANNTPERVEYVLRQLMRKKIRCPNDWQPEFTGAFCMRWYDGQGDHYGHSSKSVRMTIDETVTLSGSVEDKYSQSAERGFRISGLTVEDAVTIMGPLLAIIDKEKDTDGQ